MDGLIFTLGSVFQAIPAAGQIQAATTMSQIPTKSTSVGQAVVRVPAMAQQGLFM